MKILRLSIDSFMRVRAVEILPKGHMVPIVGNNANGKSSTLNAIWAALGGSAAIPEVPIRKGRDKAEIEVELDDIIVKRTITKASTTLTVTNKEGVRIPGGPQGILDKLVGKLTFDPLEFSRQDKKEQASVLRDLVGLDFTGDEQKRAALYNERTGIGREVKVLEAKISGFPTMPDDIPDAERSAADVIERQKQAQDKNLENQRRRAGVEQLFARSNQIRRQKADAETLAKRLREELAAAEKQVEDLTQKYRDACTESEAAEQATEGLVDEPMEQYLEELQGLETLNRRVRAKQERKKLTDELTDKRKLYTKTERAIEEIDELKRKSISEAKFPVKGLAFSEEGTVTFNGLPFNQASSAEQLRVSLAIGCALNPELRVILIRDGSLLDENNLKIVEEIAAAQDYQIWIEALSSDDPAAIVIEDGAVKE